MLAKGEPTAAMAQLWEGLQCSHSGKMLNRSAPLMLKASKQWLKQKVLMQP
jgi:hypothetical protein